MPVRRKFNICAQVQCSEGIPMTCVELLRTHVYATKRRRVKVALPTPAACFDGSAPVLAKAEGIYPLFLSKML